MILAALLGALINLNGNGHYIHWGFIQISLANFVVILLMIVGLHPGHPPAVPEAEEG